MPRLGIVEKIRRAAIAIKAANVGTSASINLFDVSFAAAATLMMAGYVPHLYTHDRSGAWQTYYGLTAYFDGVSITAFTVDRPALDWEIELVRPRVVAASPAPMPAPVITDAATPTPARSRMQLLEID